MKLIDNINHKLGDELEKTIGRGSKLSIAAASFSIFAYQELKKELQAIDELRFIFTSPTFLKRENAQGETGVLHSTVEPGAEPVWNRVRGSTEK
jgi:hypothetical protein